MNGLLKAVGDWAIKNAPKILMSIGFAGVATTAVLAAKAAPKAKDVLDTVEIDPEDSPVTQIVLKAKAVAPVYAPAIASGILTCAAFASSQGIMGKRQAALAAASAIMESRISDLEGAMTEKLTRGQIEKVDAAVGKKRMEEHPFMEKDVIETGHGSTLFYDGVTGRYFRSTMEKVRQAEAEVAKLLVDEYNVTLNEFYRQLDIPEVKIGELVGWSADREPRLDLRVTAILHPLTQEATNMLTYDVLYLKRW